MTIEILENSDNASRQSNQFNSIEKTEENSTPLVIHKRPSDVIVIEKVESPDDSSEDENEVMVDTKQTSDQKSNIMGNNVRHESKGTMPSPFGSAKSFDLQVSNWRMEKLEVGSKVGSEEEFYDCLGESF